MYRVAPLAALFLCLAELSSARKCINKEGQAAPCGPGNDQCNALIDNHAQPHFHIMDISCAENDPNAPCYDPKHGVYHLFYQDHLGINGVGGPVFGHAVSRDMTHWAHMPVAIWNDKPYDSNAIFSGSCMNDINGRMTILYPGVCNKGASQCHTGTTLNIAVPANPTDPLATNFSKLSINPIAHCNASVGPGGGGPPGSGGDPSSAWQTESKEWRVVTRDKVNQTIWASQDFQKWYWVGPQPNFPQGACPSFFPLPRTTPGAGALTTGADQPTHVYMYSDTTLPKPKTHQTVTVVGTYTDHGIGVPGSFQPTRGVVRGLQHQIVDNGTYYAGKDFWDPVKKRRLLWGWARLSRSSNTLAREVTWHPQLQQLVFSPIEEQAALRGQQLTSIPSVSVNATKPVSLGEWPKYLGNQSEVVATFALPAKKQRFGIGLMTDSNAATVEVYVDFSPSQIVGGDGVAVPGSWQVEVGVSPVHGKGPRESSLLSLLPSDKELEIRAYIDNTFVEVYFMGGRTTLTAALTATGQAGATLFSNGEIEAASVQAWHVNSIWVTSENVTSTPKMGSMYEHSYDYV